MPKEKLTKSTTAMETASFYEQAREILVYISTEDEISREIREQQRRLEQNLED